jgi:hypothetical protein
MLVDSTIGTRNAVVKRKLRGAIMVESAFVLPLIVMLIVYVLGIVSYHSERLFANQWLSTVLETARDQASVLSVNPNFSHESMLVACDDGRILVDEASMNTLFPQIANALSLADAPEIQVSHLQLDGLNQYIVSFEMPSSFSLLPAIKVRNLLTLDIVHFP